MRKLINFAPYNEAQIKVINEDGSVLCDLFGDGYNDTDICFPADSEILSLTDEDIEHFNAEQIAKAEGLAPETI